MEDLGEVLNELSKKMEERETKCIFEHDFEYPLTVTGFKKKINRVSRGMGPMIGSIVSIRPCNGDETYLGMYLGDVPIDLFLEIEKATSTLSIYGHSNPAIYVADLDKVIYGAESWWGEIKDEESLHKITDEDIENVWYVKALKQIQSAR